MKPKNKRALIITPYLDHLGGGERYMLEAASVIEQSGYQLFFAWENLEQIHKLTTLLNIKLQHPHLDKSVLINYFHRNPLKMYLATKAYDLVFYLSDGSIPLLGGKNNLIHMQVPFHGVGGQKLATQLKLKSIHKIIVNSKFTKSIIDREFKLNSTVIYPPITPIQSTKKQKLILSVGRFEPSLNIKKHDVLINAFSQLHTKFPDWRLALAGGSSDQKWLEQLQDLASGLPIDFYPNASYATIKQLYGEAKIFWHGAGFQVNQQTKPELVEHFGITTAEAITANCIPLVVPKGGQVEIVSNSDYYWSTINELVNKTEQAIKNQLQPVMLPSELRSYNFKHALSKTLFI